MSHWPGILSREGRLFVPPTCRVLDKLDLATIVALGGCRWTQRLEHLPDRCSTGRLRVILVEQPQKPLRSAVYLYLTLLPSCDSLAALIEKGA